jgi:hypothetical protein
MQLVEATMYSQYLAAECTWSTYIHLIYCLPAKHTRLLISIFMICYPQKRIVWGYASDS